MDANLPILSLKTLDRQIDESLITERLIATLSRVFGALATALAILGLYGVMTYMVTRPSREIGIRMALGAGPSLKECSSERDTASCCRPTRRSKGRPRPEGALRKPRTFSPPRAKRPCGKAPPDSRSC